jgi:hypothetical protein
MGYIALFVSTYVFPHNKCAPIYASKSKFAYSLAKIVMMMSAVIMEWVWSSQNHNGQCGRTNKLDYGYFSKSFHFTNSSRRVTGKHLISDTLGRLD